MMGGKLLKRDGKPLKVGEISTIVDKKTPKGVMSCLNVRE